MNGLANPWLSSDRSWRRRDSIDIKEAAVAQLIVRNLADHIVDALKQRALRHGRSAEAEHREILRRALVQERGNSLKSLLLEMPEVGHEADFRRDDDFGRKVEL